MLDERRVRRMAKLASYEANDGKKDIEISLYFKKDYISLNMLKTFLWITIGFILVIALITIAYLEVLMENFSIQVLLIAIGIILVSYIVIVNLYHVLAKKFYRNKHSEARERVKRYCYNLLMLERLYEKEDMNE